jgi:hypothetical protein
MRRFVLRLRQTCDIAAVITSRDYLAGTLIEALNKKLKQKKAWEII